MFYILIVLLFSCKSNEQNTSSIPEAIVDTSTLVWHWDDDFTAQEKQKIQKYLNAVSDASFKVLGNYPFKVHFYFERSDSKKEPIPWAHTERSEGVQAVRFHINPSFDYEVFFQDWTAPHEISHLSIPYLGRENSWFAEGYASYMQYQIMREMGVYSEEEVQRRYLDKKSLIENAFDDDLDFVSNVKQLRSKHNYPAMYWGGAQYFIKVNQLLLKQNTTLIDEINAYQSCCRLKDKNVSSLLKSLDRNLETPVFEKLFEECKTEAFQEVFDNKD